MRYRSIISADTLDDSEALGFCFKPLNGHLVSARGAETKGLFCFPDRQGALADGLHGLNPRNTTGVRYTLHDRGSLSERDCRKLGPSGESNAQPIESLPPGALGGSLMVDRKGKREYAAYQTRKLRETRSLLVCSWMRKVHAIGSAVAWVIIRSTFKASPGEA
jgi:hypothetical protein